MASFDIFPMFMELIRNQIEPASDMRTTMKICLETLMKVSKAKKGSLLLDTGMERMEGIGLCLDSKDTFQEIDLSPSKSILEMVMKDGHPVVSLNAKEDKKFAKSESVIRLGFTSFVCLPLVLKKRIIGAVYMDAPVEKRVFTEKDLQDIMAMTQVVAQYLINARMTERIAIASRLASEIGQLLQREQIINRVLDAMIQLMWAEECFIVGLNNITQSIEVWGSRQRHGGEVQYKDNSYGLLSTTIAKQVIITGEGILSDQAIRDPKLKEIRTVYKVSLLSILCVPIATKGKILGALYLANHIRERMFDEEDRNLASIIACHTAVALDNARLYEQERAIVKMLANAVEVRDLSTSTHVQRVARYAVLVGRRMGLSESDLIDLEKCAILHDIGKIGVSDQVLRKSGALSEADWEEIRRHPSLGVKIVGPAGLSKSVEDGILSHQERYDGLGYPRGLKGEDIPLFGRIMAVVDAYDAMTGDRPYSRKKKTHEEAIEEIKRCSGTQFDPKVVEHFLSVLDEALGEKDG